MPQTLLSDDLASAWSRQAVAREAVKVDALAGALSAGLSTEQAAELIQVDPDCIRTRLSALTPIEYDYIAWRVADVDGEGSGD